MFEKYGTGLLSIPTAATVVLEKVIRQFHGIVIAPRMRAAVSRNEARVYFAFGSTTGSIV
jgi:hypothetical protein